MSNRHIQVGLLFIAICVAIGMLLAYIAIPHEKLKFNSGELSSPTVKSSPVLRTGMAALPAQQEQSTVAADAASPLNAKSSSGLIFSCMTDRGKKVEISGDAKGISYSFGRPQEKPDMAFIIPRDRAKFTPWEGVGRYYSNSVEIPSGRNVVYEAVWASDRDTDAHEDASGLNVYINGAITSEIKCVSEPNGSLVGI